MAFDVETTGLFPGIDRIIELAGVAFDGPAVIGSFQQLVDPEVPIPPEAARVNGITDEMVRGCPGIGSALPSFLDFLRTGTPVAHNAAFDVGFVTADLRRAGLAPPRDRCWIPAAWRAAPSPRASATASQTWSATFVSSSPRTGLSRMPMPAGRSFSNA